MDRWTSPRRSFLCALGAIPWLFAVAGSRAQPPGKSFRIGVLANHVPRRDLELGAASPFHGTAAFVAGMRELGWRDGENIHIAWRSAEGRMERHPQLASELVRMPVDVIVGGDDAVVASVRATSSTPIVAYSVYSPVENGYARSLARPGGNLTGIAASAGDGGELAKSLALLKEAAPDIRRVALVAQTFERADHYPLLKPESALEVAARTLGIEALFMTFGDPRTLPELVASAARQGVHALMVDTNYAIHYHRENREGLAQAAIRHRMPVMHLSLVAAADGALMAHGQDLTARWRRAAYFVDRILRGAKPGDLPIEQPAGRELHVNLKAAKAIGLELPRSLLLQADRVFD